jgi:hypothetical protein
MLDEFGLIRLQGRRRRGHSRLVMVEEKRGSHDRVTSRDNAYLVL